MKHTILLIILLLLTGCMVAETRVKIAPEIEHDNPGIEPENNPSIEPETPVEVPEVVEKPENLIAHYKFEDNVKDTVEAYDGTIIGTVQYKQGKIGKAIYLDNSYIDVPNIPDLDKGTIAFWFNYQSLLDTQTAMPIFYVGMDNENDDDNIFIIEIGHFSDWAPRVPDPNNKKLYVTWIKNNQEPYLCYDSNINLKENTWHHFAVVVDETGNTGYLNGEELINRHYNFGNKKDTDFLNKIQNKEKFFIGYGRSAKTVGNKFVHYKGMLDDYRIYDKPLSKQEIQELI